MAINERQLLAEIREKLQERLGQRWVVETSEFDGRQFDSILQLSKGLAQRFKFGLELKSTLRPVDVQTLKERFVALKRDAPEMTGIVAARYLSSSTREALEEAEVSYIDATGNARIEASDVPFVFINKGLSRDPWKGPGRPTATLKGGPAARVVRALLDFRGPWKIRKLIEVAQTSPGSVYRVLRFLEAEALVVSTLKGYQVADLERLIQRWARDYSFGKTNSVTSWVAPRGIEFALSQLRELPNLDYVATGSAAAATWSRHAPVKLVALYSNEPEEVVERLSLRQTDFGANVRLAAPAFQVLSERASIREDGLRVATPSQVATDLLNGPGREPAEGSALINWMVNNEAAWRA